MLSQSAESLVLPILRVVFLFPCVSREVKPTAFLGLGLAPDASHMPALRLDTILPFGSLFRMLVRDMLDRPEQEMDRQHDI